MNAGIRPFPPLDPAVERLPPKRLARAGATDGQALAWDGAALAYRPATVGGNDAGWVVYSHTTISGSPSAVEVALPTGDNGRIVRIECHGIGIASNSSADNWAFDVSRDNGANWVTSGYTARREISNTGTAGGSSSTNTTSFGVFGGPVALQASANVILWLLINQVQSAGAINITGEFFATPHAGANMGAWIRTMHADAASSVGTAFARIDRLRFRTLNNVTLANGGLITVLYRVVS